MRSRLALIWFAIRSDFAATVVGDRGWSLAHRGRDDRDPKCRARRSANGRGVCSSLARSCRRRQQFGQPRQVVGRGREGEGPTDAITSPELGLLLPAGRLHPAEGFLDPFADALADGVDSCRPLSAKSGHSAPTWQMVKPDPERCFCTLL